MNTNTTVARLGNKSVKTKFGMKPTYSFQSAEGEWFNLGFSKPTFGVGDEIEFDYTPDAYGNKVDDKSINVLKSGAGTPAPTTREVSKMSAPTSGGFKQRTFPVGPMDADRAIIRQNAVTNANSFLSYNGKGGKHGYTVEDLIETARKIEAYTTGDLDVAMANNILAKEKAA